jgi:hypothetical protein
VPITAKVIAKSKTKHNQVDKYITTYELEYPRFIHAEFMTHRLFSRNAASSRAIPVAKQIQLVKDNPAKPIHWGINEPGMQASAQMTGYKLATAHWLWMKACDAAVAAATAMNKVKMHKQIVNRVLEPFAHIKVVLTTTELANWEWLRNHADAQPEIKELALQMVLADEEFEDIVELKQDQWHMPYYKDGFWVEYEDGKDYHGHTLQEALAISSSCCAQVSYRLLDDTIEKAMNIWTRLIEAEPVHASPFEHQAKPITYLVGNNKLSDPNTWQDGITHYNKDMGFGSGNFYGFIQHRQLIKNHTKWF